jgi:hypothetical protein
MNTESRTINVLNDGSTAQVSVGLFAYLRIRNTTNTVQISFDGNTWSNARLNDQFGPVPNKPSRVYFRAFNGLATTVTFDYSTTPFTAQSTSQKEASTYFVGYRSLTAAQLNNTLLTANLITSGDNGHQRKQVILTTTVNGGQVTILSPAKDLIGYVVTGAPITIFSDGQFYAFSSAGAADLAVGETYYNE